jgi:hypothetical protein
LFPLLLLLFLEDVEEVAQPVEIMEQFQEYGDFAAAHNVQPLHLPSSSSQVFTISKAKLVREKNEKDDHWEVQCTLKDGTTMKKRLMDIDQSSVAWIEFRNLHGATNYASVPPRRRSKKSNVADANVIEGEKGSKSKKSHNPSSNDLNISNNINNSSTKSDSKNNSTTCPECNGHINIALAKFCYDCGAKLQVMQSSDNDPSNKSKRKAIRSKKKSHNESSEEGVEEMSDDDVFLSTPKKYNLRNG